MYKNAFRICIITHAHEQVIFSLRFFWKLKKKYAEEIVIIVIVNLNIFLSSNDAAIQWTIIRMFWQALRGFPCLVVHGFEVPN
jgi:hypothetical protein